eukprot:TRINITY_DN3140_c0_g3_i3.p1 TRINITY_DN3140_c0_g3~~TRINITY_DN3140_c0_g3_i3.p1  ORF type:complete len:589 (-),score=136.29 TRINITY_DN3140_c0_g3_i3:84-1850(-)
MSVINFVRQEGIDPDLKRTIIVLNKFDKEVKANFGSAKDVDEYFTNNSKELGNVPVFYTSFLSPEERRTVDPNDLVQFKKLLRAKGEGDRLLLGRMGYTHYDNKQIGFDNFESHIYQHMEKEYYNSLNLIESRLRIKLNETAKLIDELKYRIDQQDTSRVRKKLGKINAAFAIQIQQVLSGNIKMATLKYRQTLEQEYQEYSSLAPENKHFDFWQRFWKNKSIRECVLFDSELQGGPQIRRLMLEFEVAVWTKELKPLISKSEVENLLGLNPFDQSDSPWETIVYKILKEKTFSCFESDVSQLCRRSEFLGKKLFPLVIDLLKMDKKTSEFLDTYPVVLENMKDQFFVFVTRMRERMETYIENYIKSCSVSVRWRRGNRLIKKKSEREREKEKQREKEKDAKQEEKSKEKEVIQSKPKGGKDKVEGKNADIESDEDDSSEGEEEELTNNLLGASEKVVVKRVMRMMNISQSGTTEYYKPPVEFPRTSQVTDEVLSKIRLLAAYHFGAIRSKIGENVQTLIDTFFKIPLFNDVSSWMGGKSNSLKDDALAVMLGHQIGELKKRLEVQEKIHSELATQLENLNLIRSKKT